MHRLRRERGQADSDVFGAIGMRRAVLHPFAGVRHDGLSSGDFEDTLLVFHLQCSLEHHGEFIKFRCLAGLHPAAGAPHVRKAQA